MSNPAGEKARAIYVYLLVCVLAIWPPFMLFMGGGWEWALTTTVWAWGNLWVHANW